MQTWSLTLCLFLLLGGGAFSATKLPANSVGTKQIKNGAVTGSKIELASLGTVPSATHATNSDNASHASSADNAHHAGVRR